LSQSNDETYQLLFCIDHKCADMVLKELVDIYKTTLYSYNTAIKRYGVYLKPVHIVVKKSISGDKVYHYYGKYWYKVVYNNGKLKWLYVGKEKPRQEIPDPPINPLVAIRILNKGNDTSCIYLDKAYTLDKLYYYVVEAAKKSGCIDLATFYKSE